ncbi:sensor histidine kinase [Ferruginibacter sp.]
MRKNRLLFTIAFITLVIILLLFNRLYKTLSNEYELSNRHNIVYTCFQNLSKQIGTAAIINTGIVDAAKPTTAGNYFLKDSLKICQQLQLLKSTVKDSINIKVADKLDKLIKIELPWLLKSNVPDSIINHKSPEHIATLLQIDSEINKGIKRTLFLIDHRSNQLQEKLKSLKLWMTGFIILSGILIINTTVSLFRQKNKREIKEKELEIVFNRINDGVISVDNDWRYTFLNDAALVAHPLGKEQTLGKKIWDVHPELQGTVFWNQYHEAMTTGKVTEIENYYAPMDTWFSVKAYPSVNGLTIFYKDISEQKSLKARQDLFVSIVDSSNDAIISKTLVGIITSWNKGAEKTFGYSSAEVIGKHLSLIIPAHLQNEEKNITEKILKAEIVENYETQRTKKDGTIIYVSLTVSPIKDQLGNIIGASKIARDITHQKESEENLIKSEKIYKTIASSIPGSVICLLDAEFRYLLIEGDMLEHLGYSKEKLLGNKAADILPAEIFEEVEIMFKKTFEGENITRETSVNGYDVVSRYIPLRDDNNKVYSIMIVAIDVTKLKNAQRDVAELNRSLEEKIKDRTEELNRSNEELESFSYSVSHDLRAPLRAVNGYARILEEDYNKLFDKEGKRLLGEVQYNAKKMGILIDDLLAFSKLGRKEIETTVIDMNKLTEQALNEINQTIVHTAEIKIENLITAEADYTLMLHVMINLIGNAIKYSSKKEKPLIEIRSKSENSKVIYTVSDNGAGFDMEYEHKLFGVFQRLHSAEEFSGTGVGLAIVQRIIQKHKGKIWAQGEVEKGAAFHFTLPGKK